jgi:hypothetical protein
VRDGDILGSCKELRVISTLFKAIANDRAFEFENGNTIVSHATTQSLLVGGQQVLRHHLTRNGINDVFFKCFLVANRNDEFIKTFLVSIPFISKVVDFEKFFLSPFATE